MKFLYHTLGFKSTTLVYSSKIVRHCKANPIILGFSATLWDRLWADICKGFYTYRWKKQVGKLYFFYGRQERDGFSTQWKNIFAALLLGVRRGNKVSSSLKRLSCVHFSKYLFPNLIFFVNLHDNNFLICLFAIAF